MGGAQMLLLSEGQLHCANLLRRGAQILVNTNYEKSEIAQIRL